MEFSLALQQTRQHFRHLGLTVPSALDKEMAEADKILERMSSQRYDAGALAGLVWDALVAGRDPVADKNVAAQLNRDLLWKQNLGPQLQGRAEQMRGDVFRRHGPAILAAMFDVVTAADKTLATAYAKIPSLNVVDPSTVTQVPAASATTWALAREATAHLDRVLQVWLQVVTACRLAPPPAGDGRSGSNTALIFADLDAQELDALTPVTNTGGLGSPWTVALAHSGHRLDYAADPAVFIERTRNVERQRAEAVRERAEASRK
ncbi:hypothetical protein [Nocardia sp. NPDC058705]|uniref:hypothetical protein n=1 Tax=Nocardia sp. NPDC058705 TaxID=3346609 RepID=UPI0036A605D9